MTRKIRKIKVDQADYTPDNSIFSAEEEYHNLVKNVVFQQLTDTERAILLHYAESGSQERTAKALNISTSLGGSIIRKIKQKTQELIKKEIEKRNKIRR